MGDLPGGPRITGEDGRVNKGESWCGFHHVFVGFNTSYEGNESKGHIAVACSEFTCTGPIGLVVARQGNV